MPKADTVHSGSLGEPQREIAQITREDLAPALRELTHVQDDLDVDADLALTCRFAMQSLLDLERGSAPLAAVMTHIHHLANRLRERREDLDAARQQLQEALA